VTREGDRTTARRRGTYAFGVVAGDSSVRAPLERFCNLLSNRMDVLLYPQVLRSYGALATQLSTGGIDLGWMPPVLAAEALAAGSVELIACLQRELGGLYHSVIFARKDSGYTALGDLNGRTISWVDRSSAAGYIVPRRWLELSGFSASTMFTRESFAGTHSDAVRAVLRRATDAGATFAVLEPRSRKLLDSGWHAVPEAGDLLRVVANAGAVPSDAIAISLRVAPEIRAAVSTALLQLEDEERELVGAVFRSSGFERCAPVYLDMLRRLLGSVPH
jgi:ABC-type phosphate/phosphonate transport system substrate-binding protein